MLIRCISTHSSSLDLFMKEQLNQLKAYLKKLKRMIEEHTSYQSSPLDSIKMFAGLFLKKINFYSPS